MASATSIMSLVRTHPISIRGNLLALCKEFGIEYEQKDTRVVLQVKINDFAQTDGARENKIRESIKKTKAAHKERLNSQTDDVVKESEKNNQVDDTHIPQPLQTPQKPPTKILVIPYPIEVATLFEST